MEFYNDLKAFKDTVAEPSDDYLYALTNLREQTSSLLASYSGVDTLAIEELREIEKTAGIEFESVNNHEQPPTTFVFLKGTRASVIRKYESCITGERP